MAMIWIPERLREAMIALAGEAYPNETGGVLVGYDAGNGLVVTDITGPGPAAQHEPAAFTPDAAYQEAEVARLYRNSGRLHTYLGDWHSHPDGGATLSAKDKRTLKRISRHKEARMREPVMAILAGKIHWELCAWRCIPPRARAGRLFYRYDAINVVFTAADA